MLYLLCPLFVLHMSIQVSIISWVFVDVATLKKKKKEKKKISNWWNIY